MIFKNRKDAGRELAEKLIGYAKRADFVVLALPCGGVPVAFETARKLNTPLDVFLVRKLAVPGQDELAFGAVTSGETCVLNETLIKPLRIPGEIIEAIAQKEQRELERREKIYRENLSAPDVRGKTVILIDDGLSPGAMVWAAVIALQQKQPAKIIVAVPVSSPETCDEYRDEVDEIVRVVTPEPLHDVGFWYEDFAPTTEEQVCRLLRQSQGDSRQSRLNMNFRQSGYV